MGIWITSFLTRQLIDEWCIGVGKYDDDVNLSAFLAALPRFPVGASLLAKAASRQKMPSAWSRRQPPWQGSLLPLGL
jgi:hypothetical protein